MRLLYPFLYRSPLNVAQSHSCKIARICATFKWFTDVVQISSIEFLLPVQRVTKNGHLPTLAYVDSTQTSVDQTAVNLIATQKADTISPSPRLALAVWRLAACGCCPIPRWRFLLAASIAHWVSLGKWRTAPAQIILWRIGNYYPLPTREPSSCHGANAFNNSSACDLS